MTIGKTETLSLDQIVLDPNNYRFRDNKNYKPVSSEDIIMPSVQKRTEQLITGKKNENIQDLITSFKESGFLPVDQIQVQRISGTDKYKVIEGNRRIATLKYLRREFEENHIDLGNLKSSIFKEIPVVLYDDENPQHYYVLMGLKHVSGNKKWPLVNQAELMRDMIDSGMSEEEVANALGGIGIRRLRRSLRALALVEDYKRSDYKDQFTADMFNIFDTAVNSTNFKEWLDWDDSDYIAQNKSNRDRFFTWISKDEESDEDGQVLEIKDPIINTGRDVRDIAKFISDEKALEIMEDVGSITDAYLSSDHIGKDKFDTTLNVLEQNLNTAIQFSSYATEEHAEKFEHINKKLKGLIASQDLIEILLPKSITPTKVFDFPNTQHFQELEIISYKKLNGLSVKDLNQVNIFAGDNNAGKTSLLESIRLLVGQNDANNYLKLQQIRGKFSEGKMPPQWILNSFSEDISLVGCFGIKGEKAYLKVRKVEDEYVEKSRYLGNSLLFEGEFMGGVSTSRMHFFDDREESYSVEAKKISHLCNFAYSSPFSGFWNSVLFDAYTTSKRADTIDEIVSFIKEYIDESIEEIFPTFENNLKRFEVKENTGNVSDLSLFGDGMQHIFRTALQFASAKNGVLLIDEIETAIHNSLMKEFSKLIQILANKFNVQVFITSHSGECIEAFVNNDFENDKISMYQLTREYSEEGKLECLHISGERYKELNNLRGLDLRNS